MLLSSRCDLKFYFFYYFYFFCTGFGMMVAVFLRYYGMIAWLSELLKKLVSTFFEHTAQYIIRTCSLLLVDSPRHIIVFPHDSFAQCHPIVLWLASTTALWLACTCCLYQVWKGLLRALDSDLYCTVLFEPKPYDLFLNLVSLVSVKSNKSFGFTQDTNHGPRWKTCI